MKKLIVLFFMLIGAVSFATAKHYSLTWKKMNMVAPQLEQIGVVKTLTSKDLANPYWSVGCETIDREYAVFKNYKSYVGQLGVGMARIQSGWARCEKVKGEYDFAWLDEVVDGLCEQSVQPWVCLCYGNPLYGAKKGLNAAIFTDDETMEAWLRYVTTTVKRYKDRVKEWEIWNEPNGNKANKPEIYAELLIRTAEAVRKADPKAVIIGFGLVYMRTKYTQDVLDILKKHKKIKLLDYVSFHPYYHNPDDATMQIETLDRLVKSYDERIQLLQGECGCPSILEFGHALKYHEWSEYSQAKWNMRRMANDFRMGIRTSVFTMVDLKYPNMLQSFGLIRMNLHKKVIYKRPSFYGVQHMVNLLHKDRKSIGWINDRVKVNTAREISVAGIADTEGKTVGVMYWYSDRIPSDELSWDQVEMVIKGLKLKNPVVVEPITGRVYAVKLPVGHTNEERMKFTALPVWDSPMFIMERSAVSFDKVSR